MAAVAIWVFAMALPAIGARASYNARVTGDEPQYLTTAISIAEDFDLDISDELEQRRFEPFHEISLNTQTIDLDDSGRRVSPHDPLLPALLALPMAVGGWVAAKTALAAMAAAAAAATVWLAVRRFAAPAGLAAVVVGAFFASPPLTAYATQVYPEMPAALCVLLVLAAVLGPLGRRGRITALAGIIALPWLSVKYAPVAAMLCIVLMARRPVGRVRRIALSSAVLVLAGVVYLVFHRVVYGGWTAYASGDHFVDGEFLVLGNDPDYRGRSIRLIGLFVDRGFGLAAWTPAYLMVLPAFASLWRWRPPGWAAATATVAAGYATATWLAYTMHGWWWPGRQLVVVMPVMVVAVTLLADRFRVLLVPVLAGCAAGILNWIWLVAEASTGRRTLVVDFEMTSNPLYRGWSVLFPNHRDLDSVALMLTWSWTAGLLIAALWAWFKTQPQQASEPDARPDPVRRDPDADLDSDADLDPDADLDSDAHRDPDVPTSRNATTTVHPGPDAATSAASIPTHQGLDPSVP